MTRPCRRITRHLLQIFLTLGLTFTVCALLPVPAASGRARTLPAPTGNRPLLTLLRAPRSARQRHAIRNTPSPRRLTRSVRSLVAVDDAPASQVVRRQLDDDPVLGQDADVVLPHLAADMGQNLVAIGDL